MPRVLKLDTVRPDRFHPDTLHADKFHEECGVFGVYGHPEAANLAYLGLYALQHRGQESAGIVSSNGESLIAHRGDGPGRRHLQPGASSPASRARLAIGHNRYSTTGSTLAEELPAARGRVRARRAGGRAQRQPRECRGLRERLEAQRLDLPVVVRHRGDHSPDRGLAARRRWSSGVVDALAQVRGAYSLVFLTETQVIAVRDPHGFRPLVLGRAGRRGRGRARETCALDLVGAEYVREVEPGEIVVIDERGVSSLRPFAPARPQALHLRVRLLRAARQPGRSGATSTRCARSSGAQLARESVRPTPTSSSRCPTPACRRRSATPRRRGSRSRWG